MERTHAWHNKFRRLLVRWERKLDHYYAMIDLASALIIWRIISTASTYDPSQFKFTVVLTENFVTQERIQQTNMSPGDDVFLIGRFINHEGKQRNLPTVRYGIISMMPWEKVETQRGPREAFLAEVKSIGGYSGSPVIVSIPAVRSGEPVFQLVGGPAPTVEYLLGVDCEHILLNEEMLHVEKNGKVSTTNYRVRSNTGMAIVIPAWKILDILDCKQLKEQREKDEEEIRQKELTFPTALDVAIRQPTQRRRRKNT